MSRTVTTVTRDHRQDGYALTRTTLTLTLSDNGTTGAVHVSTNTMAPGAWWREPAARVLRGWVDELLSEHGLRRRGARVHVQGWRYTYPVARCVLHGDPRFPHHSDDIVENYSGSTTPVMACGFHSNHFARDVFAARIGKG